METTRRQMITRFMMCMLLALAMFCTVFSDETYAASRKPARVSITSVKSADHNAVRITWKKAKNAKKYQVYRATSKNGKYKKVKTTTARTFTNTKLTTGKKYYYKVRAVNGSKKGAFSAKKAATPTLKKTTGAKTARVNAGSLKLTWKKVNGAKGYQVYRATSKNGKYTKVKTTSTLSFTNTKLTTGKTYYYKVRAYKKSGGKTRYGAFSAVVSAKPVKEQTEQTKPSEQENNTDSTDKNTQENSGDTGGEAVKPDDSGDAGENTAYGGEVREDCYLDYGSVRIYIGQKWSDSLNASINAQTGAGGAVAKTATREAYNYDLEIPVIIEIYCFDTRDYDNFLYVEVANGHIVGWKTNALTTGIIGVYEGTPIRIKTQESLYADKNIGWGEVGVGFMIYTEQGTNTGSSYADGDVMYGGIYDDTACSNTQRASIEEEEQIAEHIVNMYRACRGVPVLQHSDLLYGNETYGTKCLAKSQADEAKVAHDGFAQGPFAGMDIGECHNYSEDCVGDQVMYCAECCGVSNTYAEITIHQFYKSSAHRSNILETSGGGKYYDDPTLLAVAGYVNPETGRMYIAFNSGCVRNDVPRPE